MRKYFSPDAFLLFSYSFFIFMVYLSLLNWRDISFDSLWYAAYIKYYPQSLGELFGGSANHFLHPRHLLYNPLGRLVGNILLIFNPSSNYYLALNVMSAVFGGVAICLLVWIIYKKTRDVWLSLALSSILAFSYTFNWLATQAEVYVIAAGVLLLINYIFFFSKNAKDDKLLALLTSVGILGILVHIQLAIMAVPISLFLFLRIKNIKNKIFYPLLLGLTIFSVIGPTYYLVATTWWDAQTVQDVVNNVHELGGNSVSLSKLLSRDGLSKSTLNLSKSIAGDNDTSITPGIILILFNAVWLIYGLKKKDEAIIVSGFTFFLFFFLLRFYEERYTSSGLWIKFWTLPLTQGMLNMALLVGAIRNHFDKSDLGKLVFPIVMVVAYIITRSALTLYMYPAHINTNGSILAAADVNKVINGKYYLFTQGDSVLNLYMLVFTHAYIVSTYDKEVSVIPNNTPVYILRGELTDCSSLVGYHCIRIGYIPMIGSVIYQVEKINQNKASI